MLGEYHLINNEKMEYEKSLLDNFTNALILAKMIEAHQDELKNGDNSKKIENEFKAFADEKCMYDQVRYIDISGGEIIRINWKD